MTATVTTFREALQTRIATILSIDVLPGYLEGPIERRDIACVYPEGVSEGENVALEEITMRVRVFKKFDTRKRDPQRPYDPTDLETVAEQLQTGLDDIQTTAGPWFFRLVSIDFDMDTQMVEATVSGWQSNLFYAST